MRDMRRRVGWPVLSIGGVAFVALVAVGVVLAAVQDGTWSGSTTANGKPFSLTTSGNKVTAMSYGWNTSCSSGSSSTTFSGLTISASNTFSSSGGFCPAFSVNGTFDPSAGTASGTLTLNWTYIPGACLCSGSSSSSWNASVGPEPTPTPTPSPSPTPVIRMQIPWHDWFAVDPLETPYVGDFNGDGKTDIITFTRQNPSAVGDVYVALSDGTKFGANTKWHDWFAVTTDETVVIGDYNGDGKDDIATWLGKSTRQVYVALSEGTGMAHETVWLNAIGQDTTDLPQSGDVDGDGKDDLVLFARTQGKVYVALSTGTGFGAPSVWHGWFAVSTYERPRVADVNGDGKADIATFATDSPTAQGDVYVAISNGSRFTDASGAPNNSTKWHDWFAVQPTEQVRVGDVNGDHSQDFFTFLPLPWGQCYSVRSLGTSMASNVLWPDEVVYDSKDVPFVGDVDGDGKSDVIVFAQGIGKVYVSLGGTTWTGTQSNGQQVLFTQAEDSVKIRIYYTGTSCTGWMQWSDPIDATGYFGSTWSGGCPSGTMTGTLAPSGTGSGTIDFDWGSGCSNSCANSIHTTFTATRN